MSHNTEELQGTRVTAIARAAEALGSPEWYAHTSTTKSKPEPATGIAGALGATRAGEHHETEWNDYAASLIRLAEYIVTGRHDRDDVVPEAMIAAAQDDVDDDDVRRTIELMREARS